MCCKQQTYASENKFSKMCSFTHDVTGRVRMTAMWLGIPSVPIMHKHALKCGAFCKQWMDGALISCLASLYVVEHYCFTTPCQPVHQLGGGFLGKIQGLGELQEAAKTALGLELMELKKAGISIASDHVAKATGDGDPDPGIRSGILSTSFSSFLYVRMT